ncbi:hypothetical protein I4U23_031312 [Adineta vaga]|nr:hypothetical protein I4U23_031312 [Adineta vaga]
MNETLEEKYDDKQIKKIISEIIELTIGYQSYQATKMNQWTSNIVEMILDSIIQLNNKYKYIIQCVIMQKKNSALHTTSSCFWDYDEDYSSTFHWENQSMYAVVSVFALKI